MNQVASKELGGAKEGPATANPPRGRGNFFGRSGGGGDDRNFQYGGGGGGRPYPTTGAGRHAASATTD
jgi:hypothetical protein